MQVHIRNATIPVSDVLRDGYCIAAIWPLLGEKIIEDRWIVEPNLALLNAVSVGACQPHAEIFNARQAELAAQCVALPQTTVRDEHYEFEPDDMLGALRSCLR